MKAKRFSYWAILFLFLMFAYRPEGKSAGLPLPKKFASSLYSWKSQKILKTAKLDTIEKVHCQDYEKDRSNAIAAFGCFMAKVARMFESAPASDFLTAFGEPAIHVQPDILEKSNPDALCTKLANTSNEMWLNRFPSLPFNSYDFDSSSFEQFGRELLKRAKNNSIAVSRIQEDLFNLNSQLSILIDLLALPKRTSNFRFVIPKELCQVSKDIVVRRVDTEGFHGILGSIKIFVNLLHSYIIGLDPVRFATSKGEIIEREFVDDANGVGGDGKKFAELVIVAGGSGGFVARPIRPIPITGLGDLSALQPLMLSTLNSLITLLDSVRSQSDSEVFGHLLSHGPFRRFFQNINNAAKDLKYSLEHPGVLTPMTQLGRPNIRIDVSQFLGDLPDPKAISESDPFVLDHSGTIRIVGEFFRELFSGIASW